MNGIYGRLGKRIFDFFCAAVGIGLLIVPFVLLAMVLLVAHGRPVLFSQTRIGRHGKPFTLWKLRTMYVRRVADSPVTTAGDTRITRTGRWLRRLKIDELPQLFCVLRGDMSFVGPRPDVPGYWDEVTGRDRELLELRPGITGPVTLLFRNEEELLARAEDPQSFNDRVLFPEKVRLTWRYAQEMSLLYDLKCILYTLLPVRWLRARLEAEGWSCHFPIDEAAPAIYPAGASTSQEVEEAQIRRMSGTPVQKRRFSVPWWFP